MVVHQQVDTKQRQHGIQRLQPNFFFFAGFEQRHIFKNAVVNLFHKNAQLDPIYERLLQRIPDQLDFMVQHGLEGLPPQGRQALIHDPLHGAHFFQVAADLASE